MKAPECADVNAIDPLWQQTRALGSFVPLLKTGAPRARYAKWPEERATPTGRSSLRVRYLLPPYCYPPFIVSV